MTLKKAKLMTIAAPAVAFVAGMAALLLSINTIHAHERENLRSTVELNAINYSTAMIRDFDKGISVTEALEQIIISENGRVDCFDTVAANLISDCIRCIELAPDGVVEQSYPASEGTNIDLFATQNSAQIVEYGRDHDEITMQGPFELQQGGTAIVVRNPVYLGDGDGRRFWGFTIAIIRVPSIISDSAGALGDFGYSYHLLKNNAPVSSVYMTVARSGNEPVDPYSYTFTLANCSWKLEVAPTDGWDRNCNCAALLIFGTIIVALAAFLIGSLFVLIRSRKEYAVLAITGPLTGLLNRAGFDRALAKYMSERDNEPCVAAVVDIDNFKFINDIYGHASGDNALKQLADDMKASFPDNAIMGRIGGDEFCILLKNRTAEQAKPLFKEFVSPLRLYTQADGSRHSFTISLGFAEYPKCSPDPSELLGRADIALYEVKQRGKHGCLEFDPEHLQKKRTQLGFALSDISQNLPGAFLIYRASKLSDEMLFANDEMIKLAGCDDLDDFMDFCGRRFSGLLHPDDLERVEASIWAQIDSGSDFNNDYVQFRLAVKDGSYKPVLDHGRIVDNFYYGKVFYVMLIGSEFLKSHYNTD